MKKAKVTIETENDNISYVVKLIEKNNKISYQEEDELKSNVLFDKNNSILIRENINFYMEFLFLESKVNITIKELKRNIDLPIKVKILQIDNNKIDIKYELEKIDYYYKIEVEE